MLRQGAKIVMTSRDYIYKRAWRDLKEGAFPLFNESQLVIDVHDLSIQERQQILYNHLKLGSQLPAFRAEIKPHLSSVAAHPRFIPEIARRLAEPIRYKSGHFGVHFCFKHCRCKRSIASSDFSLPFLDTNFAYQ